uniref:XK-related protein n=1 Tax=Paramormyrops kingsleyae TaxID=1676925 RepID=A0A3B3R0H7_9TELE
MAAKSDGAVVSMQNESLPRCPAALDQRPPPARRAAKRYSLQDCCWVLCALLVFFSDGATDLWLAADYYLRRDYGWFVLTLAFVVVPSTVVQVLSFRWFIYDYSEMDGGGPAAEAVGTDVPGGGGDFSTRDSVRRGAGAGGAAGDNTLPGGGGGASSRPSSCCRACMWIFQGVVHILQLGQVWRYLHALYLGAQSRWRGGRERQHFYLRMLFASADVSMLRLLESFLKSAPQLVLQLSIMVHSQLLSLSLTHPWPLSSSLPPSLPLSHCSPGLSASASLVSLAWMMASYQKVLRDSRDDKAPMSYKAAVVQMLWHLFSIGARAAAFALFASVFQLYFGIFVVAHWCLMTFWIIQGETDFCMSKWEEIVYNMMVGIVYVFCWFNVREGGARCRLLTYCAVELAENAALTALWYLHRGPFTSDFCALLVLCAVACSQALGTFFMLVYYCLLHPDGHAQWGCIRGGADESCDATSPPRTLPRTTGAEGGDKDGVPPIFQVRPGPAPCAPAALHTPRMEGPVIRIDLPRKKYPAWDAHFIDRRLRKTILILESTSPSTPRLQYRSLTSPKEVTEYETTV